MHSNFMREIPVTACLRTSTFRTVDARVRLPVSPEMEYFLTSGMALAFLHAPGVRHHWWHRITGCRCISNREALTMILGRIREQMAAKRNDGH